MAWRVAQSLETLRGQINQLWPNRSKAADGSIGDAAHSSRSSDHNPNPAGIVCARDFTHDPLHGLDSEFLAETLRSSKDPRIKYIISNRKIASGDQGPQPWVWRKYTGSNPHNHHVHVSVKDTSSQVDSTKPWSLVAHTAALESNTKPVPPKLAVGTSGLDVKHLQQLLNQHSGIAPLKIDGDFGAKTKAAVIAFQKAKGLAPDGIVGPYVWAALTGEK